METARKGELGDKLKNFVLEHPEGAINCENRIIFCNQCGNLMCDPNLNMYLPKEGYDSSSVQHEQWSTGTPYEGADYVSPRDLREHYKLTAKYPHKCDKCESPAKVISERTLDRRIKDGTIVCPCCGERMAADLFLIRWD